MRGSTGGVDVDVLDAIRELYAKHGIKALSTPILEEARLYHRLRAANISHATLLEKLGFTSEYKAWRLSSRTYRGKTKVLNIVPSLDMAVCATSARKFNEKAASIPNAVVLVVSADLPFAMKRFCSTEGLHNVVSLSMMRGRNFAKEYGTLITDGPLEGVSARAVVVISADDKVLYTQLVPEVADEPNYDAALAAVV